MATASLYRIRLNAARTGIEIVPGSRLDDVQVVETNAPERSVETEAARFEVGNVNATVRGVADDYFREAGDKDSPFVFEVKDEAGDLLFWGVVEAAEYDRRTGRTSFIALSPEYLLKKAPKLPARSVFEVESPKWRITESGGHILFNVAREENVYDVGDIVVADLPGIGEWRAPIEAIFSGLGGTQDFMRLRVPFQSDAAPALTLTVDPVANSGFLTGKYLLVPDGADALVGTFGEPSEIPETTFYRLDFPARVEVETWRNGVRVERMGLSHALLTKSNGQDFDPEVWLVAEDGRYFSPNSHNASGVTARLFVMGSPEGESSVKLRVLGKEVYGVSDPTDGGYSIELLIASLLSVGYDETAPYVERPIGILPWLVSSYSVEGEIGSIWQGVELSEKPMEALRELQLASKTLVAFDPVLVGGLPRVNVRVSPRATLTGDVQPLPMADIIDWTEQAAKRRIDAVVVKPNKEYFKTKNGPSYVGVWYVSPEGRVPVTELAVFGGETGTVLTEAEARAFVVPEGERVITIEVPVVPTLDGSKLGGGRVVNDFTLRRVARYYYEWFLAASRPVTGTVFQRNPDILGRLVSVNEGEGSKAFSATLLVTKLAPVIGQRRTGFEGVIVPEYVPAADTPPVVHVTGERSYRDVDGNGIESVTLSAAQSYDPAGGSLAFAWSYRALGATPWTPHGGGATFAADLGTGAWQVRLVASGAGGAVEEIVDVSVLSALPTTPGTGDPRDYVSEQYVSEGVGYVRLYPVLPENVREIRWRRATGGELQTIYWDVNPNVEAWYDRGPLDADDVSVNTNGLFYLFDVPLHQSRLSYIEAHISFYGGQQPQVARFSVGAEAVAEFSTSNVSVDGGGVVRLNVVGDYDTQEVNGVEVWGVEKLSTLAPPTDAEYALLDTFDNPVVNEVIEPFLPSGNTLYLKVRLRNRDDGSYGATSYLIASNNAYTGTEQVDFVDFAPKIPENFQPAQGLVIFNPAAGLQVNMNGTPEGWTSVFHSGMGGAGSGIDADLWQGWSRADYLNQSVKSTSSPQFVSLVLSSGLQAGGNVRASSFENRGGNYDMNRPAGSGWARGMVIYDPVGGLGGNPSQRRAGFGAYGNASDPWPIRAGIATDDANASGWWNSANGMWAHFDPITGALQSVTVGTAVSQAQTFYVSGTARITGAATISGALTLGAGISSASRLSVLNGSSAQGINVDTLLVSNSYGDASLVPTNGAYIKGLLALGSQATGTTHAVRADRTISIESSLGFATAGSGNLTANRTLTITPPQDLQASSTSVQFARLNLTDRLNISGVLGLATGSGTFVGMGAIVPTTYGSNSVALGLNARGSQNDNAVSIGYGAASGTGGIGTVAVGSGAFGDGTGANVTAVGRNAALNANADLFVALGNEAGAYNTSFGSLMVGYRAGRYTGGSYNVALGWQALNGSGALDAERYTGSNTVAIGRGALAGYYGASSSLTVIGGLAAQLVTGVSSLTAIGSYANESANGTGRVALGYTAGRFQHGNYVTALGTEALSHAVTEGGADPNFTVAVGFRSGASHQQYSVAVGAYALWDAPAAGNGGLNTAVGYRAGRHATSSANAFLGALAGEDAAANNAAIGYYAMRNATGSGNAVLGAFAYEGTDAAPPAGSFNTVIGYHAGSAMGNGSKNVLIGYAAGQTEAGSNRLHIANNSSESLIYGEFDTKRVRVNGLFQASNKGQFFGGGDTLSLIGSEDGASGTHAYLAYHALAADGTRGGRSAYVGFGATTSHQFTIANERAGGAIALYTTTASGLTQSVAISGTTANVTVQKALNVAGAFTASGRSDLQGDVYVGTASNTRRIGSYDFESGFIGRGWEVDANADGTVNNLTVRRRLRVYEMLINRIRATNGSIFVTSVGEVKGAPTLSGSTYTLDFDSELQHGFLAGDLIMALRQTPVGATIVGHYSVMQVTSVVSLTRIQATLVTGDAPADGFEYVRVGNVNDPDRQGGVYLSSDDDGAPFIDIFDGVDSLEAWNSADKVKARFGNLEGITYGPVGPLTGYGAFIQRGVITKDVVIGGSARDLSWFRERPIGLWHLAGNAVNVVNGRVESAPNAVAVRGGRFGGGALEVSSATTNLIPEERHDFTTGWLLYQGATATRTYGVRVPEWGATDAVRVQTSGGTSLLKTYITIAGAVQGEQVSVSVYVKNNGTTAAQVYTNAHGGTPVTLAPGESRRVVLTGAVGSGSFQLQLRTFDAAHNLDLTLWHPQAEKSRYVTAYTPTSRPEGHIFLDAPTGTTGTVGFTVRLPEFAADNAWQGVAVLGEPRGSVTRGDILFNPSTGAIQLAIAGGATTVTGNQGGDLVSIIVSFVPGTVTLRVKNLRTGTTTTRTIAGTVDPSAGVRLGGGPGWWPTNARYEEAFVLPYAVSEDEARALATMEVPFAESAGFTYIDGSRIITGAIQSQVSDGTTPWSRIDLNTGEAWLGGKRLHFTPSDGRLTVGQRSAEHIAFTGTRLEINNGTTTMVALDGATLTIGAAGGVQVTHTTAGADYTSGGTSRAFFGAAEARVGALSGNHFFANSSGAFIRRNATTPLVSVTAAGVIVGESAGLNGTFTTTGLTFRHNGTVLAVYEASGFEIGQDGFAQVFGAAGGIGLTNEAGTQVFSATAAGVTVGDTNGNHALLDGTGIYLLDAADVNTFAATTASVILGRSGGFRARTTTTGLDLIDAKDDSYLSLGIVSAEVRVTVGKANQARTVVSSTAITLYDGASTQRFAATTSGVTVGNPAQARFLVTDTLLSAIDANGKIRFEAGAAGVALRDADGVAVFAATSTVAQAGRSDGYNALLSHDLNGGSLALRSGTTAYITLSVKKPVGNSTAVSTVTVGQANAPRAEITSTAFRIIGRSGSADYVAAEITGSTLSIGTGFSYNAATTTLSVAGFTVNANAMFKGSQFVLAAPSNPSAFTGISVNNEALMFGMNVSTISNVARHGIQFSNGDYWHTDGGFKIGAAGGISRAAGSTQITLGGSVTFAGGLNAPSGSIGGFIIYQGTRFMSAGQGVDGSFYTLDIDGDLSAIHIRDGNSVNGAIRVAIGPSLSTAVASTTTLINRTGSTFTFQNWIQNGTDQTSWMLNAYSFPEVAQGGEVAVDLGSTVVMNLEMALLGYVGAWDDGYGNKMSAVDFRFWWRDSNGTAFYTTRRVEHYSTNTAYQAKYVELQAPANPNTGAPAVALTAVAATGTEWPYVGPGPSSQRSAIEYTHGLRNVVVTVQKGRLNIGREGIYIASTANTGTMIGGAMVTTPFLAAVRVRIGNLEFYEYQNRLYAVDASGNSYRIGMTQVQAP